MPSSMFVEADIEHHGTATSAQLRDESSDRGVDALTITATAWGEPPHRSLTPMSRRGRLCQRRWLTRAMAGCASAGG